MRISKADKVLFSIVTAIQLGLLAYSIGQYEDIKHVIAHCTFVIIVTIWTGVLNFELIRSD